MAVVSPSSRLPGRAGGRLPQLLVFGICTLCAVFAGCTTELPPGAGGNGLSAEEVEKIERRIREQLKLELRVELREVIREGIEAAIAAGGALRGSGSTVSTEEQIDPVVREALRSKEISQALSDQAGLGDDPIVNPDTLFQPLTDEAEHDTQAVLRRCLDGNPKQLNPIFSSSTYEQALDGVVFSTLFGFDRAMEWTINYDFVESLDRSDDDRDWTIKLKPGLTWNDGKPFTAHDVQFSWEAILDERVPCAAVRNGTDQIELVEAKDDLTITMRHKEARPTNIWNSLFPIIPKHIWEVDRENNPDLKNGAYNNRHNRETIVSNGKYRVVEWRENESIILERWDDYPGEPAPFKRVICRIVPDRKVQMLNFIKEDLDEIRMTPEQITRQTGPDSDFAKRGHKAFSSQWALSYIGWNQDGTNPFFQDLRVRRAMAHAFNMEKVLREVFYNLQTRCYGIFHPDAKWFSPKMFEKAIYYDLDEAARLLDEAGWKIDTDRGGYRYKEIDGESVKFSFTCLTAQGSTTAPKILNIFREDLERLGVEIKSQTLEWATFLERTRKHKFEASTAAWGTGTDPDTLWNIWHSDQWKADGSEGRNYGKFQNDRVDELFSLARRELEESKRIEYYREISEIIYDEQPYLFVANRSLLWGFNKKIRGVQTSPRGVTGFDPADAGWWIPALK